MRNRREQKDRLMSEYQGLKWHAHCIAWPVKLNYYKQKAYSQVQCSLHALPAVAHRHTWLDSVLLGAEKQSKCV